MSNSGVHDREITGGGKASVLSQKFKAVNTLIGNVKTALTRTHHAIKFAKYAYRHLAEVLFRFNRRHDLRAIFGRLRTALAGTRRGSSAESGLLNFIANQAGLWRRREEIPELAAKLQLIHCERLQVWQNVLSP